LITVELVVVYKSLVIEPLIWISLIGETLAIIHDPVTLLILYKLLTIRGLVIVRVHGAFKYFYIIDNSRSYVINMPNKLLHHKIKSIQNLK
jgi:hypothetical protein